MNDEPLKDWAERRDAKIGRLRAVPVVSGDGPRASHLHSDAPRAIERWNGHAWEPHGFAANLAEAKAVLYPEASEPRPQPLGRCRSHSAPAPASTANLRRPGRTVVVGRGRDQRRRARDSCGEGGVAGRSAAWRELAACALGLGAWRSPKRRMRQVRARAGLRASSRVRWLRAALDMDVC